MARSEYAVPLPSPESLARSVPQSQRGIPSYGTNPLGQALQGLGATIAHIGAVGMEQEKQKADQDLKFGVATRYLKFEQDQRDAATQAAQQAPPGAAGFADTVATNYQKSAKEFFGSIPEELKPEYDLKLAGLEGDLTSSAKEFAVKEHDRYALEQIGTANDTLLERQRLNPAQWASTRQQSDALYASSGLPPITQDIERRKARAAFGIDLFQTKQAQNSTEYKRLLGGETQDAAGVIKGFEGYRSKAYWDVNHWRVGYGSDTVTMADGSVQSVTKDTVTTPEDAQRDLSRRTQDAANTLSAQVGAPAWDKLGAGARSALTSVYYNYGSLPESVVKAVRSGNQEAVASSIESLPANPERRKQEAVLARGDGQSGGPAPEYADIPYEDRVKLADAAQKDQTQKTNNDIGDYTSFLRSGQGAKNGDLTGAKYQLPDLQPIYGDKAGDIRKQIDDAASFGQKVASVEMATPDQVAQLVKDATDKLNSPTNFDQNAKDYQQLTSVIGERNKALLGDPASYVQKDPNVAAAFQAMTATDSTPAATVAYADATLAKQTTLGVAPADQAILPKALEQQIVSQFKTQPQGGQNAATLMQGLEGQWGKYWPKVFGEMSKDLPATVNVIGAMNHPGQEQAAQTLAQASTEELKAIEDTTPAGKLKDIRDGISGNPNGGWTSQAPIMEDFQKTFANYKDASTYQAVQDSVYRLALVYARQGDDGQTAIRRAYTDIVDKSYTLKDTFRVPIEHDADQIEEHANNFLQSIAGGLRLPISLAGIPTKDTEAAYVGALKDKGVWVTNRDESGLTLYDSMGGSAVVTASGEPETLTWQELMDFQTDVPKGSRFRH